jgi:branched-chain amino acid aminotransferase
VGGYFGAGRDDSPTGLRLRVLDQGRCAAGGTGAAKAAGNYAGGLAIARHWKAQGYDDVLFLDARHERFMTETSGANVFVKFPGGSLVTPPLDDQILAGITRDSVLRLARERFNLSVEERPLPIQEVLDSAEEVFCTGTAYTVQSVRELVHRDRVQRYESRRLQGELLAELLGIQRGDREDPFNWVHELR